MPYFWCFFTRPSCSPAFNCTTIGAEGEKGREGRQVVSYCLSLSSSLSWPWWRDYVCFRCSDSRALTATITSTTTAAVAAAAGTSFCRVGVFYRVAGVMNGDSPSPLRGNCQPHSLAKVVSFFSCFFFVERAWACQLCLVTSIDVFVRVLCVLFFFFCSIDQISRII